MRCDAIREKEGGAIFFFFFPSWSWLQCLDLTRDDQSIYTTRQASTLCLCLCLLLSWVVSVLCNATNEFYSYTVRAGRFPAPSLHCRTSDADSDDLHLPPCFPNHLSVMLVTSPPSSLSLFLLCIVLACLSRSFFFSSHSLTPPHSAPVRSSRNSKRRFPADGATRAASWVLTAAAATHPLPLLP